MRVNMFAAYLPLVLLLLAPRASSISTQDCQRVAPRGYDQYYLGTDLRFRYGANFSFVVASGLAGGGSISLVSCQGQNFYLTINSANNPVFARLNSSSAVFAQQASFVLVADAWFPGYFALRSFRDTTLYLTVGNYLLRAQRLANTPAFQESASFQFDEVSTASLTDCLSYESVGQPAYSWTRRGLLGLFSSDTFRVVPSTTNPGFVNIESCEATGAYVVGFPNNGTVVVSPSANLSSSNALFLVSLGRFNTPGFATFRLVSPPSAFLSAQSVNGVFTLTMRSLFSNASQTARTAASFLPVVPLPTDNTTAPPEEPEDPLPTPVARWVFLASNGSSIPDAAGNQSARAVRVGTIVQSCVFGPCLQLANSIYTIAAPVLVPGSFTVALWALPATQVTLFTTSSSTSSFVAGSLYPFVLSQFSPQSAPAGLCYLSVAIGLNGVVLLAQRNAATIPILMYSRPTPAVSWAQYLVSVNRSIASLYIDGQLVAVGVAPSGCTLAFFADRIGTGRTAAGVTGNYSGQLDDITLYNASFASVDALTAYTADLENARQCFRLAPDDYPSYRVDVGRGGTVVVAPTTTDTFRLVRGLAGDADSVSFLLCSSTNRYLMVSQAFNSAGFATVNLQTFNGTNTAAQLATFIRRRDLFVNGSSSYESYRYPQFFLRNRGANNGFRVAVEQVTQDSPLSLQQSASFTRIFSTGTAFAVSSCDGVTNYEPDIGTWHFDDGYGTAVRDSSYLRNTGTLAGRVAWTLGRIGLGLGFAPNATDTRATFPIINFNRPSILASANFSLSFWAAANLTHEIDAETSTGTAGVNGQRYVIFPTQTEAQLGDNSTAAIGVSVGTNGVSVYAHSAYYMPALLVWRGDVRYWTHVTVVCNRSLVSLYINGSFVRTGLLTPRVMVLSLYTVGSGWYGAFSGKLDELRFFDSVLTAEDIRAAYNSNLAAAQMLCAVGPGSTASLSCPAGQTVFAIESAAFATPTSSCASFTASACNQPASVTAVANTCVARAQCSVNLANTVFGDPCPGNKSLLVSYMCAAPTATAAPSTRCPTLRAATTAINTFVCDSGVITQFQFASYGQPTGTCQTYRASACDSNVGAYLRLVCIGRARCAVPNSELPRPTACNGTVTLRARFTCSNVALPLDNCAQAANNSQVTLDCPGQSVISSISFASFGTPTGSCGSWRTSPTCHARSTARTLTDLCVGRNNCTVTASPRVFQITDTGCAAAANAMLKVQYSCSPALSSVSVCKRLTTCGPGFTEQTPPSPFSDRVCAPCPAGTFKTSNVSAVDCTATTPCATGFYQVAPPTASSNTVCRPLTQCARGQYTWVMPTATSDRTCANCTQCPNGTTTACSSFADAVCTTCVRMCNFSYQFEASPCSRSSDRTCGNCSVCNSTQYTASPCSPRANTVCMPIGACTSTQFLLANATATSDVQCQNFTICNRSSSYEAVAATPTSDRQCMPLTPCDANEAVVLPPTPTSDRQCAPCPAGSALNASTLACEVCPGGQFVSAGSVSCSGAVCQPGTTDLDGSAASECVPCALGTTQPLAGQTGPCANITMCMPGQYQLTAGTPVEQTKCEDCPAGTFSSTAGVTACTPVRSCPPGTTQALGGAPTPTSDRLCINCPANTFSSTSDSACTAARDCLPGTGVSADPTPTSDRECVPCQAGASFSSTSNTACQPVTMCRSSQYISSPATLTSDQACADLSTCNQTSFQLVAPTPVSDRECRACSACPSGRFVKDPCSNVSDTRCTGCDACKPGLTYETQACTSTTDRVCSDCLPCGAHQFMVTPCNVLANTVCQNFTLCNSTQFQASAPTATSDRVCISFAECTAEQYESVPPTATSNRGCSDLTPCNAYEIVVSPPSNVSNWVCSSCAPGQTVVDGACVTCPAGTSVPAQATLPCTAYNCSPGTFSTSPAAQCTPCDATSYQPAAGASACLPASDCAAGFELSSPLTPVANRICTPCAAGSFKPLPGTTSSCVQADPCPAGLFEIVPPTSTSNRECQQCAQGTFKSAVGSQPCQNASTCKAGQATIAQATATTDTQCQVCSAGSFDASGQGVNRVCQSCPSGTYVAAGTIGPCAVCQPGTADLDASPATPCASCPTGTFQALAGLTSCQTLTTCLNNTGMSVAPTSSSDRVCTSCADGVYFSAVVSSQVCAQSCGANAIEFSPPGFTSDRVCSYPVTAVLPIDFSALSNNTSPVAEGLRANLTTAIIASGIANRSILAIKFAAGSTVAVVDVAEAASAERLTELIAKGLLTVGFQGQTVTAAPASAPPAASRGGSSSSFPVVYVLGAVAAVVLIAVIVGLVVRRRNQQALRRSSQPAVENDSRNLSFTNPIYNDSEDASPYMDMPGPGAASSTAADQPVYAVVKKRGSAANGIANPLYSVNSEVDAGEYMEASGIAPSIAPYWTGQSLEGGYMTVTGAGRVQADGDHDDDGYLDVRGHPGGSSAQEGDAYVDVTGAPADSAAEDVGYTDISGQGPPVHFAVPAEDNSAEDVGYVEFAAQGDQNEEESTMT